MKIRPVILCGGAGTRLWPNLKKHQAKQFIDFGGWTLFGKTLKRIKGPTYDYPIISTNSKYIKIIKKILVKNNIKKFRIQVASFKDKKKSLEVSKKLTKEFSSDKYINFEVKQIVLKNDDIFFRVINDVTLTLEDAKKLCRKVLDKKYQCLIVMDT